MIDDAARWDLVHKKIYQEGEWHSKYAEEKEKLFPRSSTVVDLGGGTGADAMFFLQNGHSVVVLDISEFALAVAQEKAKKLNFSERLVVKQTDFGLHPLPLKDASVDAAYSRISLNYFPADQTTLLFKDIYRILKPGAKAYLTLKSPDDEAEMEYLRKTAVEYEPNVYIENGQLRSRFTVEQLKNMLREAGISNFQVNPYREPLAPKEGGHHPELLVNEVVFTKV